MEKAESRARGFSAVGVIVSISLWATKIWIVTVTLFGVCSCLWLSLYSKCVYQFITISLLHLCMSVSLSPLSKLIFLEGKMEFSWGFAVRQAPKTLQLLPSKFPKP